MHIQQLPELTGLKVGLYVENEEAVYVSKEIKDLCNSEPELMKKYLRIIKMPTENGNNKFSSLADWIAYLIQCDRDIFSDKTKRDIDAPN